MASHAAFLRGINLGKNRRVKGDALCAACEAAGNEDAATFRASGNLAFESSESDPAKLTRGLEAALADGLGFEVVVFLRSAREVRAIAAHEPFDAAAVKRSKGKLQVALLPDKVGAAARRKALALATDDDLLSIRGRELYWLPKGGTIDSELDQKALEKLVGPWTMRTMGTIEQIAAKHFD
jgi:uncharacterized protein (DUF1697 family)